jgi:hypothetical protein
MIQCIGVYAFLGGMRWVFIKFCLIVKRSSESFIKFKYCKIY